MRQICSVLAGYVWDKSNPYVAQASRALGLLARILKSQIQNTAPIKDTGSGLVKYK
jgi:hypothetical protein